MDQYEMSGGIPLPPQMRLGIFLFFVMAMIVIFLFSWIPMSDKYPAYLHNKTYAPAFWTGVAATIAPVLAWKFRPWLH